MTFVPSQAQQDIFDFLQYGKGSAVIKAVAGAGKTTTLIEALKRLPAKKPNGRDMSILMLAYNKAIAGELAERVPAHVSAKTFHSLGLGALAKHFGKGIFKKIDDKKVSKLCERELDFVQHQMYASFVCKAVDLAKQQGIGVLVEDTPAEWDQIVEHYGIEQELEDDQADVQQGVTVARNILQLSNKHAADSIDYGDMVYLPLILGLKLWGNDLVFVDEAQDLNPTRRAMARKALAPGGRAVFVGDPKQSIYGFSGASHDSIDRIKEDFNCIELPLTISYRCPQAVVRKAQEIVPYIQAHPDAPEGVVRQAANKEQFQPTDAILCRNTAPLVTFAYKLLGRGVACRILGREIGKGLINLVKKMKARDVPGLLARLEAWRDREIELAIAKGQDNKAQNIEDRAAAITVIAENLPEDHYTVVALIQTIENLFDEQQMGILTLCTVHKSKGLEFPRVFILQPELMPSKWARKAWEQTQEMNIKYVAFTRAQKELILMPMPKDIASFVAE